MNRALLLLLLSLPCLQGGVLIEVEDSRLRAGDLAAAMGATDDPDLDLGPAPAPGVRRRVTQAQLVRWARQAGADASELPEELTLLRRMRPWAEAEASERLRDAIAQQTGAEVEVELRTFGQRSVPAGALEWSLLSNPRFSERPVRVALRWRDRGGRTGVESVTAVVRAKVRALVARSNLPAGSDVGAEDFRLEDVLVAGQPDEYLTGTQSQTRWTLRKPLEAGEPVRRANLTERDDVTRGSVVELVVARGAVRLRAPGRAEGTGSAGDLIPFRNLETNQRVLARITDSSRAEVVAR